MATALRTGSFHPLPVIGHPPAFYQKHVEQAEKAGDMHAKASHKVGHYVTAGLDPAKPWSEKIHCFCHALKHYTTAPPDADSHVLSFYQKLGDLVRRHAGVEGLHAARKFHEDAQKRLRAGTDRGALEDEAEQFFSGLLGHERCPNWCSREAFTQIAEIRDYWI
jgi:hypothetical protein